MWQPRSYGGACLRWRVDTVVQRCGSAAVRWVWGGMGGCGCVMGGGCAEGGWVSRWARDGWWG